MCRQSGLSLYALLKFKALLRLLFLFRVVVSVDCLLHLLFFLSPTNKNNAERGNNFLLTFPFFISIYISNNHKLFTLETSVFCLPSCVFLTQYVYYTRRDRRKKIWVVHRLISNKILYFRCVVKQTVFFFWFFSLSSAWTHRSIEQEKLLISTTQPPLIY